MNRSAFVCSNCDASVKVDPLTRRHGDPHDGCPEGRGYWIEVPKPDATLCPHGRPWHECDPCMVAADQAYDAAREARA